MNNITQNIDLQEILFILCQTFVIVIISFIHPWFAPKIGEDIKNKMRNSIFFTIIFVFCLSFSYTKGFYQSMFVVFLFFYLKSFLIKLFKYKNNLSIQLK